MPFPLGIAKPTAAGSPVQVISAFTDLSSEQVTSLFIQALPGNTGNVYVLCEVKGNPADASGFTNVAAVLQPGQSLPFNGRYANSVMLAWFWIDVVTTGDAAIATIQEL